MFYLGPYIYFKNEGGKSFGVIYAFKKAINQSSTFTLKRFAETLDSFSKMFHIFGCLGNKAPRIGIVEQNTEFTSELSNYIFLHV